MKCKRESADIEGITLGRCSMALSANEKNRAFAHLIAQAAGYRLERPGESSIATTKDGKRALLRWAKDARETLELVRAQVKGVNEMLVAIGDPTGVLFEIFRIKREDLDRLRKDGDRAAVCTVSLRDAAQSLEMVMPLKVTGRQVEEAWERLR